MAFGFRKSGGKSSTGKRPAQTSPTPGALAQLISQEIKLQPEREAILKQGLVEGMEFYHEYNEARLDLAFESFDPEMRMALFELIYLLHTNGPSLSEVAYLGTYLDTTTDDSNGTSRQVEGKRMMNLYVEGAPHGIKGLQTFSPVFNEDFRKYVSNEFGGPLSNVPDAIFLYILKGSSIRGGRHAQFGSRSPMCWRYCGKWHSDFGKAAENLPPASDLHRLRPRPAPWHS